MSEYITVGKITTSCGIKGEVKVIPYTDFPERFAHTKRLFICKEGFRCEVELERANCCGKYIIMKLEGIDSPEKAAEYRNALLQIPRDEVWPLPEGSYYHFQIVGLKVFTVDGLFLGQVVDILETGSNDVYVIRDDRKKEHLLPALRDVVRDIDLEKGLMVVQPLPGLFEE
jgi:16S rRNA processing protein RimM